MSTRFDHLPYWAEQFEQRGYRRYMTFVQFMRDPAGYVERYDGPEGFRPLLPRQKHIARRLQLRVVPKQSTHQEQHA